MSVQILKGDCRDVLRTLPAESVHCVVTSPPYFGLRDYGTRSWEGGREDCQHEGDQRYYTEKTAASSSAGAFSHAGPENAARLKAGRWREGGKCIHCGAVHVDRQIGLELTPDAFVTEMVAVFGEVRRVLRNDGTLWLNLGDSYAGSWGNYGGQNRSAGKQRAISAGSRVPNEAWDERTKFLPPAAKGFPGIKPKDLIGIPWRVAFALQAAGWWLRQDIIWSKPNPMPESVTDRCTKAHEYLFLLSKSERYYFDAPAIAEASSTGDIRKPYAPGQVDERGDGHDRGGGKPRKSGNKERKPAGLRGVPGASATDANGGVAGSAPWEGTTRNKRSVWTVNTQPFPEAHFATFPAALVEPCIKAGAVAGGMVLDPFGGAGTVGMVADRLGRDAILIELNPEYAAMAERRINADGGMFSTVTG